MVIVMPDKKYQLDFVTLTSIHYCLKRCSGPILVYNEHMDFSSCKALGIVGHGAPGKIEGLPAESLADVIINGALGVNASKFKRMVITSCYAGSNPPDASVINTFAKALAEKKIKGVKISGAIGPSIKADSLGDHITVVDDGRLKEASALQTRLTSTYDYGFLGDLKVCPDESQLAYQAEFAAEVTHAFFKDFVAELGAKSLLLEIGMREVTS